MRQTKQQIIDQLQEKIKWMYTKYEHETELRWKDNEIDKLQNKISILQWEMNHLSYVRWQIEVYKQYFDIKVLWIPQHNIESDPRFN